MPTEILLKKGKKALKSKNYEKALEFFERALSREKELVPALMGKAKVLWKQGALAEAEQVYIQVAEISPNLAKCWVELIKLEKEGGADQAAAENLASALRILPGNEKLIKLRKEQPSSDLPEEHEKLLESLRQTLNKGKLKAIKKVYQHLEATLEPDCIAMIVARGEVYLNLEEGNLPDLIHILTRFSRYYPDSWPVLTTLGRLLLRNGPLKNTRMAVALCEDAWRISGENKRAGIGLVEAWAATGKTRYAEALCVKLAKGKGTASKTAKIWLKNQ